MTDNSIEISVNGQWVRVPAIDVDGTTLIVTGRTIRLASVHDEAWLETGLADPERCVRALKAPGAAVRADVFTFSQKLPQTTPMHAYTSEPESLAVVHLTSYKEWWEGLPQETRKNVRRAQKRGVVVEVRELNDQVIQGLADLNNDSPTRQGRPNRHYGKSLDQVRKDYASFLDRSDVICAYVGEEMIGLLKIVYRGDVASILQCLPKSSHYDKRPANALIAKAMEVCAARNISYVTYGMFRYGNKRDNPLLDFKIRNGFTEMVVPRYYVPLTSWGALCVRARLHRGLIGLLPHEILAAGVRARAKWHNLKDWMSRCSSRLEQPNSNRQMERANPPAGSNT